VAFSTWSQVVDYANQDPYGSDLAVAVKLIERLGPDAVIDAVGGAVPEGRAEVVVSTVHRAKGREWARVRGGSDFPPPAASRDTDGSIAAPEAMLGYVAVTRAKLVLDSEELAWIHDPAPIRAVPPGGHAPPGRTLGPHTAGQAACALGRQDPARDPCEPSL
jgi:hypothetical protein